MKKSLLLLCIGLMLNMATVTAATTTKTDIDAGKKLAQSVCAACHGMDGNSVVGMYPKLAGQHAKYTLVAMHEFKKGDQGKRNNPIMLEQMKNLSDAEMENVAAYYATQAMSAGGAVKELVPVGQMIYRGGNMKSGVPACMACHGPTGTGNAAARFPRLAGQQVDYLIEQLQAFRSGERQDIVGGMMNDVATRLTDDEIKAVASYISGLH